MSKKKFTGNISAKGYYIALVLCAVAIGISGFLYYRNVNKTTPDPLINGDNPGNGPVDQEVIATGPNGELITNPDGSGNEPVVLNTVSPLQGQTVAAFAMDSLTYNPTTRDWRVHNGMDIAAEAGSEVCAAADGTVYSVYEDDAMGMTVVISHAGGYTTRYASLDKTVSVKAGDTVAAGQVIGMVGNTALLESAIGDHLHFGVTRDGKAIDPNGFLKQE